MPKFVLDVESEEEKEKLLLRAIYILQNLRRFTKEWEEKYGQSKIRKKSWENKADDFLKNLNISEIQDEDIQEPLLGG